MKMTCGNCPNTDGMAYMSDPPQRRCIITGELHTFDHVCELRGPVEPPKPRTVKQIKTISTVMSRTAEFDALINEALKNGWKLKDRFLSRAEDTESISYHPCWVAFLEKEVEVE